MRCATCQFSWEILKWCTITKLSAWLDLLFKLHRTAWGVLPASSDGKYYRVSQNKFTACKWVVIILHWSLNHCCHTQTCVFHWKMTDNNFLRLKGQWNLTRFSSKNLQYMNKKVTDCCTEHLSLVFTQFNVKASDSATITWCLEQIHNSLT